MTATPTSVKRTYYALMLGNTVAASLIWGINTIFLLDAGLNNLEAFAANAFFTAGMVIFEVPTGIVADMWGRRMSFLLGTVTLAVTTALYVMLWQVEAPFWSWALVSLCLGLGFTFFSGAVEAWLVDALSATQYQGTLESVLARGQIVTGVGMLTGSIAGGFLAQAVSLGFPFVLRAAILDPDVRHRVRADARLGFEPQTRGDARSRRCASITANSIEYGWRVPVGQVPDAGRTVHRRRRASTSSTRSSRTCSSSTATRPPTGSPVSSPRSSPARRSSAASRRRSSAASSAAGPRR